MLNALDIHVTGIVQGVGFRPFVYRLAKRYLVNGWVLNAVDGVHIHAEGEEQLVDEFIMDMHDNPPAAAVIKRIDMKEVPLEGFESFEIRFSDADDVAETTLVSPDLATCDDCLEELFDPANRRYHYPFINCTNCGPRFTIIDGLPYDRAKTSMADFEMCADCAAEYADPANRRFHAQPDACFECGPRLNLWADEALGDNPAACRSAAQASPSCAPLLHASKEIASQSNRESVQTVAASSPNASLGQTMRGVTLEESEAIIARAVELLHAGKIVAVKGLGGFHLVCDAGNAEALAQLRRRKRREGKAFAVMVQDVEAARAYCAVSTEEEAVLTSPARPIVLLRKLPGIELAVGLADKLPELGVMLPATPVQHLLVRAFGGMLVFTSGNVHDEPIQTGDEEARVVLAGIADAFLGNDRPIRSRYDDSVVRVLDFGNGEAAIQFIRRARGYAPLPIAINVCAEDGASDATCSCNVPTLFATGPEQKNTFCFLDGQRAFVSQHIGDMENAETFDAWLEAKATYEQLFELAPTLIACDMHPEYLTSKWAADQPLPVRQVQHHHAHIVSAMAEHGLAEPVLGFAFDGTGFGPDGAIWGGEVLLANLQTYERFANLAYFPLPGGAAAIKNPLRCAYGALWAFDLLDHPAAAPVIEALGDEAAICERMIETGLNTPYTSSVGRLFDAASAILGLCDKALYEGEPAVLLEAALEGNFATCRSAAQATPSCAPLLHASKEIASQSSRNSVQTVATLPSNAASSDYHVDIVKNTATEQSTALDTSVVLLDAAPLFKGLLDDLAVEISVPQIARKFHDAFVETIVQVAQLAQAAYDINTVVLSGGVFMNRYLCEQAVPALAQAGFTVAMNKDLPPNDGCISLGQAVVVSHRQ